MCFSFHAICFPQVWCDALVWTCHSSHLLTILRPRQPAENVSDPSLLVGHCTLAKWRCIFGMIPKTPTAWFPRRKKIGGKGLFHMPFLLLNLWLWINPVFYAERNEWKRGMSEKEDWGPENCILGFSVKTKQSKTTKQNTRVREEMHPCSTRIGSEACLSFSGKVPIPHSCVCVCLPALLMVWFTMW